MGKVNFVLRRIDESRLRRLRRVLEDAGIRGHVGGSLVVRTGLRALDTMDDAALVALARSTSAEDDESGSTSDAT